MTNETLQPKRQVQTTVVDAIREAILAGDLAPGQRLVEADLCEALTTSRGTLRTALAELQHEGLVERIANRGARVRIVSLDEALHLVEVRMTLEMLCIGRAAARITEDEAGMLSSCAEALKARVAENDIDGFAELTHKIFQTYVEISAQPVAAETLARVRERLTRHSLRLTYRPGRAAVALPYWLNIVEALCARDAEAAQTAVRLHAENVAEFMASVFAERQGLTALSR